MKKLALITFSILIPLVLISQPCPDSLCLTSQAQVDSFQVLYPQCTEIEGDVKIFGDDIINLDGLNNLTSIGGTLQIGNNINSTGANPVLASLGGLGNLSAIEGDLRILGNDSLVDLSGLESLTSIGGSLLIGDWWNMWPCANLSLLSLDGLDNVASVGDGIQIVGGIVEDISALSNLTSINGHVMLRYIGSLQSLDGLNNISSIGGGCTLWDLGVINFKDLDNLNYIGGGLDILSNDSLTSLTGLEGLTSVGSLGIFGNDSLTSLVGLENIDAASIGDLSIRNNSFLSYCAIQCICDYLASPNGEILIQNNSTGCQSQEVIEAACDTLSINEVYFNLQSSASPNPFTTSTSLSYTLDEAENVQFTVYNVQSQIVFRMEERQDIGVQEVVWNAEGLPAGMYYYRIQAGDQYGLGKLILLR
jgi:hypothetical protein